MKAKQVDGTESPLPGRVSLIAWFALITGLMQVGVWLFARYVVHRAVFIDRHVVWAAPVANLVAFCAIGLLLLGLGRIVRPLRSRTVLIAVLAVTACYTVLLMLPRVSPLALLLLAIGVGVQAGRWLAARPALLRRIMSATTAPLAALFVAAALFVHARPVLQERSALGRLPAPPADAPNVLFIIWDTVRAASMSLYGYARPTTPFLDEFARTGAVFDRAYATAPWTLASHGSFFTGYYPFDLSASWDVPLDARFPTVAEELSARGYATAAFVANHIFSPPEFGLARGFRHYEGRPLTVGTILGVSPLVNRLYDLYNRLVHAHYVPEARSAENVTRRFWRWRNRIDDRPYFAFLNYFDAHEPYLPPAPYDRRFGAPEVRSVVLERRPTEQEVRDVRDAYDGAIAYLDDQLRQLIAELQRRGELERTIVIIASDHGEHLGEYGLLDHGNTLYPPLLQVPLVVAQPARVPSRRIADAISLRDLPATIFDLVGLEPRRSFPGRSLARLWTDAAGTATPDTILAQVPFAPRQPEWYPLAAGDMRSIILWPLQLIVDGRGGEQVFDLARDPNGLTDIASQLPAAELDRLRAGLARYPERARVEASR